MDNIMDNENDENQSLNGVKEVTSSSLMASSIRLQLVIPETKNESTLSNLMSEVHDECLAQSISVDFVSVDDVLGTTPTKKHVFVMENFEDKNNKRAFEHLTKHPKCTVLGTQCLLLCLKGRLPVPRLPQPMLTAAMRGLVVTSTGFNREWKLKIAAMVEHMAGIYVPVFHDGVTHLVAEVVKSPKSEVALSRATPVMSSLWVTSVYEASIKDYRVHATDGEYMKLTCPPLKGLNICLSQLNRRDKDLLRKTIENNGGIYSPVLDMNSTAILVLGSAEGEKFTFAQTWKIPCVNPNWILDSVERQMCLPTTNYTVKDGKKGGKTATKASTPNKDDMTHVSRLDDLSMCSTILAPNDRSRIDETADVTSNSSNNLSEVDQISSQIHKLKDEQRLKSAGRILRDCVVYLSGFSPQDFELFAKAVKCLGGRCAKGIDDKSVTHIITGSRIVRRDLEYVNDNNRFKVSSEWLIESLDMAQKLPEEDFKVSVETNRKTFDDIDQRELEMLRQYSSTTEEETRGSQQKENDTQKEEKSLKDPLKDSEQKMESKNNYNLTIASMNASTDAGCEATCLNEGPKFLSSKTLAIVGFEEEHIVQKLQEWIEEFGGTVEMNKEGENTIDYLIVSIDEDPNALKSSHHNLFAQAKNIVTELWIEECIDSNQLLDPNSKAMFRGIWVDRSLKPCNEVVIGITNYSGNERLFITKLALSLGMTAQEIFAKRDKKGAKRSTHLICCKESSEGAKYEAALKWNLPIVTLEWLLTCAQASKWVSEKPFLVGKATAFTQDKPIVELQSSEEKVAHSFREPTRTLVSLDQSSSMREKPMITPPVETAASLFDDNCQVGEKTTIDRDSEDKNKTLTKEELSKSCRDNIITKGREHVKNSAADIVTTEEKKTAEVLEEEGNRGYKPMIVETTEEAGSRMSPKPTSTTGNNNKLATPDQIDFEKLRPRKSILHNLSSKCTSHLVDNENEDNHEDKDRKRKRDHEPSSSNDKSPFYIHYMKTPETPYGATRKGEVPSAKTRKLFKAVYQDLCRIPKENKGNNTRVENHSSLKQVDNISKSKTDWMRRAVNEASQTTPSLSGNTTSSNGNRVYKDGKTFGEYMGSVLVGRKRELWLKWSKKESELGQDETKLENLQTTVEKQETTGAVTLVVDSQGWTTNEHNNDSVSVRWKDPREEEEQEKMRARVSSANHSNDVPSITDPSKMDTGDNITDPFDTTDPLEGITIALQKSKGGNELKRKNVFMLSTVSEDQREKFIALLKETDSGEIIDSNASSKEATHFIAGRIRRSEKILGSIASGKWVLHSSYIDACLDHGGLVDEADYEWSKPRFEDELTTDSERKLAKAGEMWRRRLSTNTGLKGAFDGMRGIIMVSKDSTEAFERLLSVGGGHVVKALPPFKEGVDNATHLLIDLRQSSQVTPYLEYFAQKGIAVVSHTYINEYLVQETRPTVDAFLIGAFKKHWQKYKRESHRIDFDDERNLLK